MKIDIELTNRLIYCQFGGTYSPAYAAENFLNRKRKLEIKERTININEIIVIIQ